MPSATINDFRLHYERAGSGPLLVLLHGLSSNARSWQHQLQDLAPDYDVVAWDMRGYGSSSDPLDPYSLADVAADLAGLLDQLGFEQAHVGGLGLGASIAVEFANRFGGRARSLTLVGLSVGQRDPMATRPAEARSPSDVPIGRLATPPVLSPDAPPEVVHEAESIMAELHPDGYRYAARAQSEADVSATLTTLTLPTLVVRGEADALCTQEDADELARLILGARQSVIPNAGHLCNQENAPAFNEALRQFLASVD